MGLIAPQSIPRSLDQGHFLEEVHKITVLDLRMANAGNILFRKEADGHTLLIPIDHGYCLLEKDCTFDWLYWPQARQHYSPDTVDYIKSLDAEKDIELLKYYKWDVPIECAQTLCISTMLLKKEVERGLTPFDIGSIMAYDRGIHNLVCESDSKIVLHLIKENKNPFQPYNAFIHKIQQYIVEPWHLSFKRETIARFG
ncbi:hypothetical protein JHK87_002585 [Glycine soja]|nr:hypothetical protein JHK87_002585 [Glycine soja]